MCVSSELVLLIGEKKHMLRFKPELKNEMSRAIKEVKIKF